MSDDRGRSLRRRCWVEIDAYFYRVRVVLKRAAQERTRALLVQENLESWPVFKPVETKHYAHGRKSARIAATYQDHEVRFQSKDRRPTRFPAFASARRCDCARK